MPFVLQRLVVPALIATSARSTEWGRALHGPRMIFSEKIGIIFILHEGPPLTSFSLSVSLLERMILGEMTLVITIGRERGPASLDSGAYLVL